MKTCSKCGETKALLLFHKDKATTDGYTHRCGMCRNLHTQTWRDKNRDRANELARKWRRENPEKARKAIQRWHAKQRPDYYRNAYLLRIYGLTVEDVDNMRAAHKGLCPICKSRPADVVDHHKTQGVRDVLCDNCNKVLGLMRERPDWLRAAALYLEEHNAT